MLQASGSKQCADNPKQISVGFYTIMLDNAAAIVDTKAFFKLFDNKMQHHRTAYASEDILRESIPVFEHPLC